jgi:hypothetical protein
MAVTGQIQLTVVIRDRAVTSTALPETRVEPTLEKPAFLDL